VPYRKELLADGEIYHVLNRAAGQIPVFTTPREYRRFLTLLDYYKHEQQISYSRYQRLSQDIKDTIDIHEGDKLVEIYSYCIMPNHFHLLLKQLKEFGISKMIRNIEGAFVRYFNLRHDRKGPLFESMFKAIRIESEEQFLHVSRYIHLNPSSSFIVKIEESENYPWSSLPEYIRRRPNNFIDKDLIIKLAGGAEKYKKFVYDHADYQRELDVIKHLVLE
jgi:putative transposase